jgi:glycosyltransferase involved in cell wall biosynthesis|tara:strand:- start:9753 stop:10970 length:1218 start_codon:yes stop_codon:yes gene_type:complete
MKVLHVLNGGIGGAALSTIELIAALEQRGVTSYIYCTSRVTAEARQHLIENSNCAVYFGPMYIWTKRTKKKWFMRPVYECAQLLYTGCMLRSSGRIKRICQELEIDIVHSSTSVSPDGAIAAASLGLPHVWHIRELFGAGHNFRIRGDRGLGAGRRFCRSGWVVANSAVTKQALYGEPDRERVSIVSNGIRSNLLGRQVSERNGPEMVFGMIANLSAAWKKHEVFIRAASLVLKCNPDARFVIYGEVPSGSAYANRMIQLAESLGLRDVLRFPGYQSNIAAIMSSIDVVVHPATDESFGRIFIEAAAFGRPVLAGAGGAAYEIIVDGETGILVHGDNVQRFADEMALFACNRGRIVMMGDKAAHHAAKFSIEATAERVSKVYAAARAECIAKPLNMFRSIGRVIR